MQLSEHFSMAEMTSSEVAVLEGIDNQPTDNSEIDSLKFICENILEPIRAHYDTPFSPSSGYRCQELNDEIGGVSSSQHCLGEAADISVPGVSNLVLAWWIRTHLDFDQLILEHYEVDEPENGWVHVSTKASGSCRHDVLTYDGESYTTGIPG